MTNRQTRATQTARRGLLALALTLGVSAGRASVSMPAVAAPEQALWYQAYDQGVKATRAGEWALAISALEVARRGGPAPGRRVAFQGDRVDVFNPDYYLGLAYNATRRYGEAEAAFARVASAGLVRQGDREFEELRKQTARATYERTLQDGDRAVSAGRFADAEKALQALIGTLADDGRAGKLVERARESLNAVNVTQPAPSYPPASTTPVPTPPPPVPVSVPTPVQKAPPSSNPRVAITTTPPRAPVRPGYVGTPALTITDAKTPANRAANPIENAVVDPRASAAKAPVNEARAELEGMTAYLAGDYDAAIRILRPVFDIDPPSQRVAFYLACSYVARAVLGGAADKATLDEAQRMFTYAAGDSTQFAADRGFISPAVLRALGSTAPRAERRAATAS